jgi:cbb3-type cytochrome oxidase subunit 3
MSSCPSEASKASSQTSTPTLEEEDRFDPCVWRGKARYGRFLLLPITALVILYTIMVVAMLAYSAKNPKRMETTYYSASSSETIEINPTPIDWKASSAVSEVVGRLLPVMLELLHLPYQLVQLSRGRLHPIGTLCFSLFFWMAWSTVAICGTFQDVGLFEWPVDFYPTTAWNNMTFAKAAITTLLALVYIVYMSFAARATDVLRVERRARVRAAEIIALRERGGKSSA